MSNENSGRSRRHVLLSGAAGLAAGALPGGISLAQAQQTPAAPAASSRPPNIVVIWGDDVGLWNISAISRGQMGYRTPNIDRIFNEGMTFTDYYAEQSCTAGRSAFVTGQATVRTGLSKVGLPGAAAGMQRQGLARDDVILFLRNNEPFASSWGAVGPLLLEYLGSTEPSDA